MNAESASEQLPFHLQGNFAPVQEERTAVDLEVQGSIPPELRGLYLRNGPNPRSGVSPHWFFGDGMVHGVALADGEAKWYRNRWVRTRPYLEEEGSAILIQPDGTVPSPRRTPTSLATAVGSWPWWRARFPPS